MTENQHDWSAKLRFAEQAKAQLNETTDDLTPVVKGFVEALNARRFGVEVTVRIDREEHRFDGEPWSNIVWEQWLSYRKQGKEWGLWLESSTDDGDPSNERNEELLKVGRELKFKAIEQFPALLDRIISELQQKAEERAAAIARARDLTALLNGESK
jgi:hypothetical protein